MGVVLAQRALKPLAVILMNLLRPMRIMFSAEDPALVILGFDYKHAEAGNHDVVDLGSGFVGGGERYVVQGKVIAFVEEKPQGDANLQFAPPALEPGRARKRDDDHKRKNP